MPLTLAKAVKSRRVTIGPMPSDAEADRWVRHNDAVREADRLADRRRSMTELLEETARLSQVVSELRGNIELSPDVRSV